MCMAPNYASQRRRLLALQHEERGGEADNGGAADNIVLPPAIAAEAHRQRALSVPESGRALGEPLEPFFAACGGRRTLSLSVRRVDSEEAPETFIFQQPFVIIGRCPESDMNL